MSNSNNKIPLSYYFFNYSGRYTSGSFDMREVVSWYSEGEAYYKSYCIVLKNGEKIGLTPEQFRDFEDKFRTLW